jgi:predicted DNA-binding transcriptional regulator AlpA
MWLWRRLKDTEDDFPQPIYIAGIRYWRLSDLEEYAERKVAQANGGACMINP